MSAVHRRKISREASNHQRETTIQDLTLEVRSRQKELLCVGWCAEVFVGTVSLCHGHFALRPLQLPHHCSSDSRPFLAPIFRIMHPRPVLTPTDQAEKLAVLVETEALGAPRRA